MITVRELAEELGISKTAVHKRIDQQGHRSKLKREGNKILIPDTVADQIRLASKPADNTAIEETISADIIQVLREQLEQKDEQIRALQEENKELIRVVQQSNHLLMANTMKDADQEQPIEADQTEVSADPEEKEPKKSWFRRLFG